MNFYYVLQKYCISLPLIYPFLFQPILFPGLFAYNTMMLAIVLALAAAEQFLAYYVGLISGSYYQALGRKDMEAFKEATARAVLLILSMSAVKSARIFSVNSLTVGWRRTLTIALHRLYFKGIRYYEVNVLGKGSLDNPDQRLAADISTFCSSYGAILVDAALAPFTLCYYSYSAYSRAGWLGPTAAILFFFLSTVVNKTLMSPIVALKVEEERREGDFRFKHVAVRTQAESLAFHGSATVEAEKVDNKLDRLCDMQQKVFNRKLTLDLATNTFDYMGSVLSYLVIAVPIFAGTYDHMDSSELSRIISENAFVCMYLIYQVNKL